MVPELLCTGAARRSIVIYAELDCSLFSRGARAMLRRCPERKCCSSAKDRTAVHIQNLTGNMASPVGAKEHDTGGHVIGQGDALQRYTLLDFALVSVVAGAEDRVIQLGVNPAGSNAVHADAGREFNRQRFGKTDLPTFG